MALADVTDRESACSSGSYASPKAVLVTSETVSFTAAEGAVLGNSTEHSPHGLKEKRFHMSSPTYNGIMLESQPSTEDRTAATQVPPVKSPTAAVVVAAFQQLAEQSHVSYQISQAGITLK